MTNTAKSRLTSWLFSKVTFATLLMIVVSCVAYGLFYVPALYSDDWTEVIGHTVLGWLRWLDLTSYRPLYGIPRLIQYSLFGLSVHAYYIFLGFLYVCSAVLIYAIGNHFPFMRCHSCSLIVALLFLVFPTNYAHMWLTMVQFYFASCLTLLYALFVLRFARGGHGVTLVLALACQLLSLGTYAGPLGVACAWPLILLVICRKMTVNRRLGLFMPILLSAGWALWRTLGYQAVGIYDRYLPRMVVSPGILLSRLILGYKVSLGWGWTATVQYLLPWLPGAKCALLLLAGVTLALWWSFSRIIDRRNRTSTPDMLWSFSQRWPTIRVFALSGVLGLILIGAGYVPIITLRLPSLSGLSSRDNLFASLGASVILVSMLMIGALLFSKTRRQVKPLLLVSAIPFIMLGIATQASVQYHTRIAWQEQQSIWQELFVIAPDFADGTLVVFVLPGYQDRVGYMNRRRTPFYASWGVSRAIRLLYDNPTLAADVVFPDTHADVEATLTVQGIVNQDTRAVTPYAQSVFFVYDNDTGTLRQLDELPVDLVEGASSPIKLDTERVLEGVPAVPLRRLVED